MNQPDHAHTFKGFTLVELMVTVAILAILLSIAVPSFNRQLADNRMRDTASIIEEAVKTAITESSLRRQDIEFNLNNNNNVNNIVLNSDISGASTTIKSFEINQNSKIALAHDGASITNFVVDPNRRVLNVAKTEGISVTFTVCDNAIADETGRTISVNAVGRVTSKNNGSCT